MWTVDADFCDGEDIVAKIQYVHDLAAQHPYAGWMGQNSNYMERVETSIDALPKRYHDTALALFANVIYLPQPMLEEAWREIGHELASRVGWSPSRGFETALFLAIDNAGLVDAFSHANGIPRREDHDVNPGYGTVSALLDDLIALIRGGVPDTQEAQLLDQLRAHCLVAKEKRWWVVLTDLSLSGGSAVSDIQRLEKIATMCCAEDRRPDILLCAQVITSQALLELQGVLPTDRIFYGVRFGDQFRVNSKDCALFNQNRTRQQVRALCDWFGNTCLVRDNSLRTRLEEHTRRGGVANYAYGWRDGGYTIVTQSNCPSNSVPVLYHSAEDGLPKKYSAPFLRTESRESHKTSKDGAKLRALIDNEAVLRQMLSFGTER